MKETDISWAAGFFDGEGTIQVIGKGYRRNPHDVTVHLQYQLVIAVTQKDFRPIQKLIEMFGGTLFVHKHPYKGYQLHRWTCVANVARAALEAMLPFLVYKNEQAKVALEFQDHVNLWRGKKGMKTLPTEVWQRRLEYKQRISSLISEFVCAAAETKPTDSRDERCDSPICANDKGTEGAEMPPRLVN